MKEKEYRVCYLPIMTNYKDRKWTITFANSTQEAADNVKQETGAFIINVAEIRTDWN